MTFRFFVLALNAIFPWYFFQKSLAFVTLVCFFCWLSADLDLHFTGPLKTEESPTDGFNHWGFHPGPNHTCFTPLIQKERSPWFSSIIMKKNDFSWQYLFVFNKIYCNKSLLYIIIFLLQDWFIFCHLHFFCSSFLGSKSPFIDRSGLKQMSTHCWRVMVVDPQRRAKDVNKNYSDLAGDTCQ